MASDVTLLEKSNWPPLLQEIPDRPKQLYIRGSVPDWNRHLIAVVGSRTYTQYGKEVCQKLIAGLRGYPITIVSGLALGIDAIAHRSALDARLPTIAIPGSGLNPSVLYPASHAGLAERILDTGGALISEFPPDFRATVWSFPQRNRIMAGMSHAILVIEAQEKSGSLITSRLATEYNRDVLTVPGSIFSPQSAGPHMLIRLGATPITKSEDILQALHLASDTPASGKLFDESDCTTEEKMIIDLLNEPKTRDELTSALSMSSEQINTVLSIMELKGYITESLGKIRLA